MGAIESKTESTFLTEIEESMENTTKEMTISELVGEIEDSNEVQLEKEITEMIKQSEESVEETVKELLISESIGEIEDKDEVEIVNVIETEAIENIKEDEEEIFEEIATE